MKYHRYSKQRHPKPHPGSGLNYLTILSLMLLGAMLLTACRETKPEDWPQLAVLASNSLQSTIVPETGEFERMDGTRLKIEFMSTDELITVLRSGKEADVILLDDWAALMVLEKEQIVLGAPWQFHLKREGIVAIAPEGSGLQIGKPDDLLNPDLGGIGFVENGQGYTGRLTKEALHSHGILKPIEERLWQARSRGQLAQALRTGKQAVGLVSEKDYEENAGHWREGLEVLLRIPFTSDRPDEYAGGIAQETSHVKAARRFWNFIEKVIRVHQAGLRSQTHERM